MCCFCRLFNLGYFNKAEKIYVNWDGASDNVNYTCLYALIHFLLCAEKEGWPLKQFVILRMPVGHTHVLLDAAWGMLSRMIYGTQSRGDARRDVLDWLQLQQCCSTAYGDRYEGFEHIRGCYNFDEFVASYRSPSVDAGISTHYAIELSVSDGVIMARSKDDICPETPWSTARQLFPPVLAPGTSVISPSAVPTTCELQPWKNGDKVHSHTLTRRTSNTHTSHTHTSQVRKDLRKFYEKRMSHRVTHIPDDVAQGMFAGTLDA